MLTIMRVDDYPPQLLYASTGDGSNIEPIETLEFWLGDESDRICM